MDTMRPLSMGADAWEGGLGSRSRSSFEYPKTSVPGFTPFLRPQLSHNFLTEIRIQLVAVVPQKKPTKQENNRSTRSVSQPSRLESCSVSTKTGSLQDLSAGPTCLGVRRGATGEEKGPWAD